MFVLASPSPLLKVKDSILLNKNSEFVKQLSLMLNTGATAQQIGNFVMKDMALRDAVKAVLLKDINGQCQKLCKKSDDGSSVLRVPRSKHKVSIYINSLTLLLKV